ncbi:MAG: hypothetical protein IPP72_18090 [Chitinophagaceae bacterium]|nr:hypothetical protein [Chitinophagaceae bacterium]
MIRKKIILFFCLAVTAVKSTAQYDPWPGKWQMEYAAGSGKPTVFMEMQIAIAEKNILYPAHISLQCDSFYAGYELLLVKKSARELGISKNKYPVSEKPFSLADATFFLNGIFDYSRDFKGNPIFTINRIQSKHNHRLRPDTMKTNRSTAEQLLLFLKDADIKLTKINSIPWNGFYSERILSPSQSPAYFGLLDTIYVPARDGFIHLSSLNKNDVVTAALNGTVVSDKQSLNRKPYKEEILLDTGLNILVLFADNFSNELPNKGKMELESGKKKIRFDFSKREDSAASFIAAKLFFEKDKDREIYFRENNLPDKPLKENEKLLGNVVSVSRQLNLAIWDDAVEDGDSISININGEWVAKGFPVKNSPQFITVTLKPGPNTITFAGDNLGSIPPNTSVLELIDGKKRKSFMLETVPGEDNLLKIFYVLKPD